MLGLNHLAGMIQRSWNRISDLRLPAISSLPDPITVLSE